jgi:hypothetical protein
MLSLSLRLCKSLPSLLDLHQLYLMMRTGPMLALAMTPAYVAVILHVSTLTRTLD